MNSIIGFFGKFTIEKKFLTVLLTPILTLLLGMKPLLFCLVIMIFIDFITGLNKSLKIQKANWNIFNKEFWKKFKSHGVRKTWKKTYEYGVGIIVFAIIESLVFPHPEFDITIFSTQYHITEVAVILACIIEVHSVFENIEETTGRNLLKKLIAIFIPSQFREKK